MLDGPQNKLRTFTVQRKADTYTYMDSESWEVVEKQGYDKTMLIQAMNREELKTRLNEEFDGEWVIVAEHKPK